MNFPWDKYSDQPYILKDKAFKKMMRRKNIMDYVKLILTNIFLFPIAILVMKLFKKGQSVNDQSSFYGIGVNLDKGDIQVELIEELNINNLLIRIPLSDIQNVNLYFDFISKFKDKNIVIIYCKIGNISIIMIYLKKISRQFLRPLILLQMNFKLEML